jgi:hypothetical protein
VESEGQKIASSMGKFILFIKLFYLNYFLTVSRNFPLDFILLGNYRRRLLDLSIPTSACGAGYCN